MRELTIVRYQSRKKKPGPTARRIAKRRRAAMKNTGKIRAYVFDREEHVCRCCRIRMAESMHELVPRSLGGKISKRNSVAVCGQFVGTELCCHTFLQQHEIDFHAGEDGAEGLLQFMPKTEAASEWMRVKLGLWIASMPAGRNEEMPA